MKLLCTRSIIKFIFCFISFFSYGINAMAPSASVETEFSRNISGRLFPKTEVMVGVDTIKGDIPDLVKFMMQNVFTGVLPEQSLKNKIIYNAVKKQCETFVEKIIHNPLSSKDFVLFTERQRLFLRDLGADQIAELKNDLELFTGFVRDFKIKNDEGALPVWMNTLPNYGIVTDVFAPTVNIYVDMLAAKLPLIKNKNLLYLLPLLSVIKDLSENGIGNFTKILKKPFENCVSIKSALQVLKQGTSAVIQRPLHYGSAAVKFLVVQPLISVKNVFKSKAFSWQFPLFACAAIFINYLNAFQKSKSEIKVSGIEIVPATENRLGNNLKSFYNILKRLDELNQNLPSSGEFIMHKQALQAFLTDQRVKFAYGELKNIYQPGFRHYVMPYTRQCWLIQKFMESEYREVLDTTLELAVYLCFIDRMKDQIYKGNFVRVHAGVSPQPQVDLTNIMLPKVIVKAMEPLSFRLGEEGSQKRLHLIVAPNESGKSVCLQTLFLSMVLAQSCGVVNGKAFRTAATISLFDKLFSTRGAGEDIEAGFSSGSGQLANIASQKQGSKNFAIFDELFSGLMEKDAYGYIEDLIKSYKSNPQAVGIFVSHFKSVIERYSADTDFTLHTLEVSCPKKQQPKLKFTRTYKLIDTNIGGIRWWIDPGSKRHANYMRMINQKAAQRVQMQPPQLAPLAPSLT